MKYLLVYAPITTNNNDPYNPKFWAAESLMILVENMVMAGQVNRDFENQVSRFGDTVNTRRPRDFAALRKGGIGDPVVQQPAISDNVAIVLNQIPHVTFPIYDIEQSYSFQDLIDTYMYPGMIAMARFYDQCLAAQVYQFLPNIAGHLNLLDSTTAKQTILEAQKVMTTNKVPLDGRNVLIGQNTQAEFLQLDLFNAAYAVGDNGQALANGTLGRKLGLNFWTSQNTPFVPNNASAIAKLGAVNNPGVGYAAGTTILAVDTFPSAVAVGQWVSIAGDDTPQLITAQSGTNTTSITIFPGLLRGVADNATITAYAVTATTAAYTGQNGTVIGYGKAISVSSVAGVVPGQLVAFGGVTTSLYGVIAVDTVNVTITLDRPLDADIASGAVVGYGPTGSFNFAFHKDALTLASRPLALPRSNVKAAVQSYNGISVRVVIAYDKDYQCDCVTIDSLFGIKVLDKRLGAVLLG
jgi:hypothetical protein